MELKSVSPHGTFHARVTKDATALNRDGRVFMLIDQLESRDPADVTVEVMFADGFSMLAQLDELEHL